MTTVMRRIIYHCECCYLSLKCFNAEPGTLSSNCSTPGNALIMNLLYTSCTISLQICIGWVKCLHIGRQSSLGRDLTEYHHRRPAASWHSLLAKVRLVHRCDAISVQAYPRSTYRYPATHASTRAAGCPVQFKEIHG